MADEKQTSNSKQGQVPPVEVTLEQGVKDSDIDAAKVAAMKAAELGILLIRVVCISSIDSLLQVGENVAL